MKTSLVFTSDAALNPQEASVYVDVDGKIVKADAVGPAAFPESGGTTANVVRGAGGISIDFEQLTPGQRIFVAVGYNSTWWISDDLTVPSGQMQMNPIKLDTLQKRIKR